MSKKQSREGSPAVPEPGAQTADTVYAPPNRAETKGFGGNGRDQSVGGCKGLPEEPHDELMAFDWNVELGAAPNYRGLARCLAAAKGDLYRRGTDEHGLVHVSPTGKFRWITAGADLAPLIVDRTKMRVFKEGKLTSELPTAGHLRAMLRSEAFLQEFRPVDEVVSQPLYLDDFQLTTPGYNDGGPGKRVLYVGPEPVVSDSTEMIEKFLSVMSFSSICDRTNTVAAALTVCLRRHWPGEKPLILVTASKSHSGKGTLTEFFRGRVPKADILYESVDWPMLGQFQRQVNQNPEIGIVVLDNVRCDSSGSRAKYIRSGFIESFVTNAEILLASPGAGEPLRIENHYVVTINTNDGKLSSDLLNRSNRIHLALIGDLHDRKSPIGNPKLEFLPAFRGQIDAELRGMIERWRIAGCPLDDKAKHPMLPWSQTIGGILKFNGFTDFLANSADHNSVDDPVREALAILALAKPDKALRPRAWARIAVEQGLAKILFSPNERDTEKSRERAIGVVLSRHLEETFTAHTDTQVFRFRLTGGCRRWVKGNNPHVRYEFEIQKATNLPIED